MPKKTSHTIYAKGRGVEILPACKERKDAGGVVVSIEGRVRLRFFDFSDSSKPKKEINFFMTVVEANFLGHNILRIAQSKLKCKNKSEIHRSKTSSGVEFTSHVEVERYSDGEEGKYAVQVFRGGGHINVSMNEASFLFVGSFLQYMAMHQSYFEYLGAKKEEGEEVPVAEEETRAAS